MGFILDNQPSYGQGHVKGLRLVLRFSLGVKVRVEVRVMVRHKINHVYGTDLVTRLDMTWAT